MSRETKITIFNSSTTGAVPPGLYKGELAVNLQDHKLFIGLGDGAGGTGSFFDYGSYIVGSGGSTGATGPTGATGTGLTSVMVDPSTGFLKAQYLFADGTTSNFFDIGYVKGATGATGPVGNYVISVGGLSGTITLAYNGGLGVSGQGLLLDDSNMRPWSGPEGKFSSSAPLLWVDKNLAAGTARIRTATLDTVLGDNDVPFRSTNNSPNQIRIMITGGGFTFEALTGNVSSTGQAFVRGVDVFNYISQNLVTSVNGATGAITNVARTNSAQTFTGLQSFSTGISSAGGIFSAGLTFTRGLTAIVFDDSAQEGVTILHTSPFVTAVGTYLTIKSEEQNALIPNPASIQLAGGDNDNTPSIININASTVNLNGTLIPTNIAATQFLGSVSLQNGENIRNTTNGRVDFMPAPTGGSNYGMYVDNTSWGFGVRLGTIRSSDDVLNVGNFLLDSPIVIGNDVNLGFGGSQFSKIRHTATGLDTFQIGVTTRNANTSGAIAIMDGSQFASSNRSPGVTHSNPNLYIYSSNPAVPANDFIRFEHDMTHGNIISGTGDIRLDPQSSNVVIDGNLFADSIKTNSATTNLLNETATTINFGGQTGSTVNIGNTGGSSTIDFNANVLTDMEMRRYFETTATGVYTGGMVQSLSVDLSTAQVFTLTTSGNISTISVSNTPTKANTGVGFTLIITQGGGHTMSWASWSPGTLKWAGGTGPSLTVTAGKTDIFSFVTYDNGTNWYGFVGGQNF